jgi:polyribonucleotide nucleotidyltransferase
MFDMKKVEIEWGGKTLKLETGRVARQADGAVLATLGETVVLCAVTAAKNVKPGQDFFPLTVTIRKNSRPPGASRAASSSASAAPPKRRR